MPQGLRVPWAISPAPAVSQALHGLLSPIPSRAASSGLTPTSIRTPPPEGCGSASRRPRSTMMPVNMGGSYNFG